eukprot:2539561-Pyramimonas_sp.AAC.1
MLDDAGNAATTQEEIAHIAQTCFANIEAAKSVDSHKLLEEYNRVSQHPTPRPDPVLEFLPTLVSTEQALRKCPANKAAGMDGIVADLGKCANESVVRLAYPLLLKTC